MDTAIKGLALAALVGLNWAVWAWVIGTYMERRRERRDAGLLPVVTELTAKSMEKDETIEKLQREVAALNNEILAFQRHFQRCNAHQPATKTQ